MKTDLLAKLDNVKVDTISSIAVLLFYLALFCNSVWGASTFMLAFWYGAVMLCVCLLFFFNGFTIKKDALAYLCVCALTGIASILHTGNCSYVSLAYTLLSVLVAMFILEHRISSWSFFIPLALHEIFALLHFARYGISIYNHIYANTSNNFLSVQLLYVLLPYYVMKEQRGEKISIIPALTALIPCILAQGRGGMLTIALLIMGIFVYQCYRAFRHHKTLLFFLSSVFILLVLLVLVVYLDTLVAVITGHPLFQRVRELGVSDNGRFLAWRQYIESIFGNGWNMLFGAPLSKLSWAVVFGGNLHNSFLNIHAFNGLIMLLFVVFLMCKGAVYGIRERKWIYLVCFFVFCLRSGTDRVFWSVTGTPIFLFFLMLPSYGAKREMKKEEILRVD